MYEIIKEDRKALSVPCDKFDFTNPPVSPTELAEAMIKIMYDNNGIGLAANQIGLNYRVFAMRGSPENFVMFNPKIVSYSDDLIVLEEGCLSFPYLYVKVKRPKSCRVRFTGPNGETFTNTYTGMTARIIQHEIDHLDGVLFFNKANYFHKEKAFKDRKLLLRKKDMKNDN